MCVRLANGGESPTSLPISWSLSTPATPMKSPVSLTLPDKVSIQHLLQTDRQRERHLLQSEHSTPSTNRQTKRERDIFYKVSIRKQTDTRKGADRPVPPADGDVPVEAEQRVRGPHARPDWHQHRREGRHGQGLEEAAEQVEDAGRGARVRGAEALARPSSAHRVQAAQRPAPARRRDIAFASHWRLLGRARHPGHASRPDPHRVV